MDLETLGYLLYMDKCDRDYEQEQKEKERAAALRKYQVDSNYDLVDGLGTHTEN